MGRGILLWLPGSADPDIILLALSGIERAKMDTVVVGVPEARDQAAVARYQEHRGALWSPLSRW
jgi:hypothetical protein